LGSGLNAGNIGAEIDVIQPALPAQTHALNRYSLRFRNFGVGADCKLVLVILVPAVRIAIVPSIFIAIIGALGLVILELRNAPIGYEAKMGFASACRPFGICEVHIPHKNILRVVGRSLTELEVRRYSSETSLLKIITDYLDIFFKIKGLPISREFPALYSSEARLRLKGLAS
jgi:hypothetical protein